MIAKTRVLSFGIALMPWLGMLASADLEVTKWGDDGSSHDVNVGIVPPVDIKTGEGKFTVFYNGDADKSQVDILESGRVVYSDVDNVTGKTAVTYMIHNAAPGADYSVRVKVGGLVRSVAEVPVNE